MIWAWLFLLPFCPFQHTPAFIEGLGVFYLQCLFLCLLRLHASVSQAVCITFMDWVHECLCFLVLPSAAHTLIFLHVHFHQFFGNDVSFPMSPAFFPPSLQRLRPLLAIWWQWYSVGLYFPWCIGFGFRVSGFVFPVEVHQLRFRSWLPSLWARFGFSLTKPGRFVCIGRSRDPAMHCAYSEFARHIHA
jgi:hypothetical protein